eukprot:1161492-Pelagomonas_calceolata.AAC.5
MEQTYLAGVNAGKCNGLRNQTWQSACRHSQQASFKLWETEQSWKLLTFLSHSGCCLRRPSSAMCSYCMEREEVRFGCSSDMLSLKYGRKFAWQHA